MVDRRTLAGAIAALVCLLVAVVFVLDAGAEPYRRGVGDHIYAVAALLPSLIVGLILAVRRSQNPIGWLLLLNAGLWVLSGFALAYAGYALAHPGSLPGGRFAAMLETHGWPLLFVGLVAVAFIFPDGRLPSPRWRGAVVLAAASFALTFVGGMLSGDELDEPFAGVEPYGVLSGGVSGALQGLGLLGMIVSLILAALAVRTRFRGADGVLRAQLRWITYAAVFIPVAIVAGTVEGVAFDRDPGVATALGALVPMVALPAAIGVAVLRYRLYEIDRLVDVTLVYGTLTALLAGTFGAVTVLGGVSLGRGSTVTTAAATLAVALAFRPLRSRVQSLVDRRFNPERYDGLRQVDRFLEELREGHAEPEATGAVLARAVSDPELRLYFWLPLDDAHADERGHLVTELPSTPPGRTPVRRGGLQLGTLVHDPRLAERPQLLDALIRRAGLAIEIARLRVEVRRQLAEVEESRARIVAAGYEERRRLERDLHDGAQQRLVSIGLDLRHVQRGLAPDDRESRAGLDHAVRGLGEAIDELRELARGVRPSALDGGLAPALQELASRAPIQASVAATAERFGRDIEAAAYFVASEGLTNAVKHAAGSQVELRATRENGKLVLSVEDRGPGGASAAPGSGLAGLSDRVAALGGRLSVTSEPGRGTAVVAEFPCE